MKVAFSVDIQQKRAEHLQLQMKGLAGVTDVYILINHTTVLKLYDMGADVEE